MAYALTVEDYSEYSSIVRLEAYSDDISTAAEIRRPVAGCFEPPREIDATRSRAIGDDGKSQIAIKIFGLPRSSVPFAHTVDPAFCLLFHLALLLPGRLSAFWIGLLRIN